ncbi:MAG: IS21 family transposase [Methanobacteriota archaeon]|nr:MAG: IS21 family transposase [Euryarchaeota archaeon]
MVKENMVHKIHRLKARGWSKSRVARELGLDRKTVRKYWDMSVEDYRAYRHRMESRFKKFEVFKDRILEIYSANGDRKLNIGSVYDLLEEEFGSLPATEKSLRNYIHFLVMSGQLVLSKRQRMYMKVPEQRYGKQMQVDFGQYRTKSGLKLYIFAAVLSASRFKVAFFQERPFTTVDIIEHLLNTFDVIGGMPEELVIDQDAALVVSENRGDIIYTKKFAAFIEEMGLRMYVCRKGDPESKGKIENFIKYIKHNFFETRDFTDVETANERLRGWLHRRANGKLSRATDRVPAEMWEEERLYLRKVRNSIFRKKNYSGRERRKVSDQSFVMVSGNEYSVPIKYRGRVLEVYETPEEVIIYDDRVEVARHVKSPLKGQKIAMRGHFREDSKSIERLREEVFGLHALPGWSEFLEKNTQTFPRYRRDQYLDAKKYFSDNIDEEILALALDFCLENQTYSYKNLKDSYDYFAKEGKGTVSEGFVLKQVDTKHESVSVEKRSVTEYMQIVSEAKQ